jgi:hypothetical protein
MQDTYNLSVIKTEGIEDTNRIQCSVWINHELAQVTSMMSFETASINIRKGKIKLVVENTSTSLVIGTVSFCSDIIQRSGFHWMPLFFSSEDEVFEIPDEVGLPRILFDINPNLLSPVIELTESSEGCENTVEETISQDLQKIRAKYLDTMVKLVELENRIENQSKTSEIEISRINSEHKNIIKHLNFEIEKLKAINSKIIKNNAEITKDNQSLKKIVETQNSEKKIIEERLNKYLKLYDETKLREESIVLMLEEKDKEILKFNDQKASNKNFTVDTKNCFNIQKGPKSINQNGANLEKSYMDTLVNSDLKDFKKKYKIFEQIDKSIQTTLKKMNLEGFAVLSNELTYIIGNKKLQTIIKNDTVYIKVDGILKTLENYIHQDCNYKVKAFLKRLNNLKKDIFSSSGTQIHKIQSSIINQTFDSSCTFKTVNSFKPILSAKIKSLSPVKRVLK